MLDVVTRRLRTSLCKRRYLHLYANPVTCISVQTQLLASLCKPIYLHLYAKQTQLLASLLYSANPVTCLSMLRKPSYLHLYAKPFTCISMQTQLLASLYICKPSYLHLYANPVVTCISMIRKPS